MNNRVIIEQAPVKVDLNISEMLKKRSDVFHSVIHLFGQKDLSNGECLVMIAALSAAIIWRTQFPKDSFAQILTVCLENAQSLFEPHIIIPAFKMPVGKP